MEEFKINALWGNSSNFSTKKKKIIGKFPIAIPKSLYLHNLYLSSAEQKLR